MSLEKQMLTLALMYLNRWEEEARDRDADSLEDLIVQKKQSQASQILSLSLSLRSVLHQVFHLSPDLEAQGLATEEEQTSVLGWG